MVIKRRQFIQLALSASILKVVPVGASTEASLTEQRLMSCRSNEMGEHFVTLFNTEGKILWNIPLARQRAWPKY